MNKSNSHLIPPTPRVTLKLKPGARKSPRESETLPIAAPTRAANGPKPGAHWSDEYKERMQRDMDALAR
jgi:hypothetical protein